MIFSFDFETHLITSTCKTPKPVCLAIADDEAAKLHTPTEGAALVIDRLRRGEIAVGANVAFDFGVLLAHSDQYPQHLDVIMSAYDDDRVWDVQLAERLYAIGHGTFEKNPITGHVTRYSLEDCVTINLGRSDAKANDEYRLRYSELDGVRFSDWPASAAQYPIDDVKNTLEVYYAQIKKTDAKSNYQDQSAQARAAWAMYLGSLWGFVVDQETVAAFRRRTDERRAPQVDKLKRSGILSASGTLSTSSVKKLVVLSHAPDCPTCEACQGTGWQSTKKKCGVCRGVGLNSDGEKAIPLTEKGAVSYSRDTLIESGDDNLLLLAEKGRTDKAANTYLPWLESIGDDSLLLHPNPLLVSGRASDRSPIQTLPKEGSERECFYARPGSLFFSVDYEGLELATHAQSCVNILGASVLADTLNAGGKPHDMLAAKLMRVSDAQYGELKKTGDRKASDYRTASKPANFGFPGFMGPVRFALSNRNSPTNTPCENGPYQVPDSDDKLVQGYFGLRFCVLLGLANKCGDKKITQHLGKPIPPLCVLCVEASRLLRDGWLATFPENREMFSFVKQRVADKGEIVQHYSGRVRAVNNVSEAANGYFQGLAADGAKRALWAVTKAQRAPTLKSVLYGSRTILMMHDELLGEVFEEKASDCVKEVCRIMILEMKSVCPDVPIFAEPTLMRRWYKAAKPVYDLDGNVQPWR